MIPIARNHSHGAVQKCGGIAGIVRERTGKGMGFDIGLVDDIQAMLIAEVQPVRVRRVVRAADRVEMKLFDQPDVLKHLLPGERPSACRAVAVTVDPEETNPAAVDQQRSIPDLDGAKSCLHCCKRGFPGGMQGNLHAVEPRGLRGPKLWLFNIE